MSGDSPTPVEELGLSKHDLAMIDVNQLSPEERERSQGAVVELDLLLTDPQFVGDYEKLKTTKETASLKSVEEGLSKEVRLKIKGLIEQTALAKTGHADVAAAQKNLGKQWGAAMQGVVEVYYEGKEYPIDKMNNPELEAVFSQELQEKFTEQRNGAVEALSVAQTKAHETLGTIDQDLKKHENDPRLLKAMSVWGRSPDSNTSWGPDDKGFHAGVTHYFEYRRNSNKAGRYDDEKIPFGLDGYIALSEKIGNLISQGLTENPNVLNGVHISDELGQNRLILLSKVEDELDLLVAFQRVGEPIRVISVIPVEEKDAVKTYQKAVDNEMNPKPGIKKLNSLGEVRTIVERK